MRRYEAMPELKKAELIDGVVYVASPVRHTYHGKQDHQLAAWLGQYEAATPGVEGSGNCTVFLDLESIAAAGQSLIHHTRVRRSGQIERRRVH